MLSSARWLLLALAASMFTLQSHGQGSIRLPDQPSALPPSGGGPETQGRNGDREGRNLLDWVGLGTGPDQDPYVGRTNQGCLSGDLADCFKSQALTAFSEFFSKETYRLTESARIIRMPESQLRSLIQEPYEFSGDARGEDSEWDALVKFASRKLERFLKSSAFEIDIDNGISEEGRYSPRFINEIAEEIDVLEDKKAPLFKRNKLKKLFIPMLLILKLFKLKLLLFLPLILGLASFKKLLGFLAIVIPGLIGYFKLCKPNIQSPLSGFGGFGGGGHEYYNGPQYSPAGLGVQNYGGQSYGGQYAQSSHHYRPQESFYGREQGGQSHSGGIAFRDESPHDPQDLAYQGWQYRNSKSLKEGEEKNKA